MTRNPSHKVYARRHKQHSRELADAAQRSKVAETLAREGIGIDRNARAFELRDQWAFGNRKSVAIECYPDSALAARVSALLAADERPVLFMVLDALAVPQ